MSMIDDAVHIELMTFIEQKLGAEYITEKIETLRKSLERLEETKRKGDIMRDSVTIERAMMLSK